MKFSRYTFLFALIIGLFSAFGVFAQNTTFSDPNAEYTFIVPDAQWKMTVKPSATTPNVEYVFNDRQDGHLEVRKLTVKPTDTMAEIIRGEEERVQFLPGYVSGKQEQFAGNFKGSIFNYEFVTRGRTMSGRSYFLRIAPDAVYLLRFKGERDKMRSIRNFTDSMARTFDIKKVK